MQFIVSLIISQGTDCPLDDVEVFEPNLMIRSWIRLPLCLLLLPLLAHAGGQPRSDQDSVQYKDVLTIQGISQFIETQQIHSVDDLLSRMPPRLLSSFTLAYQSQSLQANCANKKTPRVLLFSPEDDFVMAVTGNLSTPGCGNIEMMKFDQKSRRFDFQDYQFAASPSVHHQQPNSAICMSCHGTDLRPIWASYPTWPGFFTDQASSDDTEGSQNGEFLGLKKAWINQPVYRRLNWNKADSLFPYSDSAQSVTLRPNFRLGIFLNRENAKRLARVYEETPGYPDYKYPIEAQLLNCPFPRDELVKKLDDLSRFFMSDNPINAAHPGNIFKPDWFSMNKLLPSSNSQNSGVTNPDANDNASPDTNTDADADETEFTDGVTPTSTLLKSLVMDEIASSAPEFSSFTARTSIFDRYPNTDPSSLPLDQQVAEEVEAQIFPEALKNDLGWIDEKGQALSLENYTSANALNQACDLLRAKLIALESDPTSLSRMSRVPYNVLYKGP
jgi:hypothetical protein